MITGPIDPTSRTVSPTTENRKVFTSSGTFLVPFGVKQLYLTGCAGGAGGGSGSLSSGSPSLVQSNVSNSQNSNSSTQTITFSSSLTNANTLILIFSSESASSQGVFNSISSISQTGTTWTQVIASSQTGSGKNMQFEIWYANNISGASSTVTINVNNSGVTGGYNYAGIAAEYSGLLTSSVQDQSASNFNTGTSADSGTTGTTSQASELWIAGFCANTNPGFSSPTNGFTIEKTSGNGGIGCVLLDKVVSTTGTANTGVTLGSSVFWIGGIVTFKAVASTASGGGGGGGGASITKYPVNVVPFTSFTVSIGTGGSSATNGGNTSFGSNIILGGGSAGSNGSTTGGSGGNGGSVTITGVNGFTGAGGGGGGSFAGSGGNGGNQANTSSGGSTGANGGSIEFYGGGGTGGSGTGGQPGAGGGGGASLFGVAGNGGTHDNPGTNASNYGSGGGGGGGSTTSAGSGGSGSSGFLLIEY